jgi:hypothetical protein
MPRLADGGGGRRHTKKCPMRPRRFGRGGALVIVRSREACTQTHPGPGFLRGLWTGSPCEDNRGASNGYPHREVRSGGLVKTIGRNMFECKPLGSSQSRRRTQHRVNSIAHLKSTAEYLECLDFGAGWRCRSSLRIASLQVAGCKVGLGRLSGCRLSGCKVALWLQAVRLQDCKLGCKDAQGCMLQAGRHRRRLRRRSVRSRPSRPPREQETLGD